MGNSSRQTEGKQTDRTWLEGGQAGEMAQCTKTLAIKAGRLRLAPMKHSGGRELSRARNPLISQPELSHTHECVSVIKHNIKEFTSEKRWSRGAFYRTIVSSFTQLVAADLERKCPRTRLSYLVCVLGCGPVLATRKNCC